jgi:hypothetical protein
MVTVTDGATDPPKMRKMNMCHIDEEDEDVIDIRHHSAHGGGS